MQAVVLAAGKGDRLGSLGKVRSKAMQPLLGTPLLGWILADLAALGLTEVVVVRAPQDQELARYLSNTGLVGISVRQAVQEQPAGMADALVKAAPLIARDFLLLACDNRVERLELQGMRAQWQARPDLEALLGLLEIPPEQVSQSGIVAMDGERIVRIIEKPALQEAPSRTASIPVYGMRRSVLERLPEVQRSSRGELELQDALQQVIDSGGIVEGWRFSQRQVLTRPRDLLRMNLDALRRHLPAVDVRSQQVEPGVQFLPPVLVEAGASIGRDSLIGPGVYLEAGAQIGRGARLSASVVLRQGVVAAGSVLEGEIVS